MFNRLYMNLYKIVFLLSFYGKIQLNEERFSLSVQYAINLDEEDEK